MKTLRLGVSNKGVLVALAIVVLLLGGGGGYLLWRVNQQDTVAPTESEAAKEDCVLRCTGNDCTPRDASGNCPEDKAGICYPGYGVETGCCHYEKVCNIVAYYVVYQAGANGSVSNAGKNEVSPGGSITSTATPSAGYKFVKWNDGKTTATRTESNVNADATFIAEFTALGNYTLKYETDIAGTLEGVATQTVQEGKDGTAVKVNNKGLMIFKRWSDNKKDNPRIDKAVKADLTVKAIFESSCGNNTCDSNENAKTCPNDCPAKCPDGFCTHDETAATCPQDCPVNCGDKICSKGEDANNCPKDCVCGDKICSVGEDASTCPEDCNAVCGDGMCTTGESSLTCPKDCGSVPETGLFDNSRNVIVLGSVLLLLGMVWTWVSTLPKRVIKSFSVVSDYVSNVRDQRVRNKRESRRSRLERRIK